MRFLSAHLCRRIPAILRFEPITLSEADRQGGAGVHMHHAWRSRPRPRCVDERPVPARVKLARHQPGSGIVLRKARSAA